MRSYIAIDTETTGLDPRFNRICEVGCVKFLEDGTEVSRFQSLVNPGCEITQELIAIHGITNEMVANERLFPEVALDLLDYLGESPDAILLAHNASFDAGFLTEELKRSQLMNHVRYDVLCTLSLARRKYRILRRHRLIDLIQYLNLPETGFHRSISDCVHLKNMFVLSNQDGMAITMMDRHYISNY